MRRSCLRCISRLISPKLHFLANGFCGLGAQRQSNDNIAHVFATLPRLSGGEDKAPSHKSVIAE